MQKYQALTSTLKIIRYGHRVHSLCNIDDAILNYYIEVNKFDYDKRKKYFLTNKFHLGDYSTAQHI